MSLQEKGREDKEVISLQESSIQGLRTELDTAQASLTQSRHAVQQLEAAAVGAAEQIADLQKQVGHAEHVTQVSSVLAKYCTEIEGVLILMLYLNLRVHRDV